MAKRTRYVPSNSRAFNRLLKLTYGIYLRLLFRIEFHNAGMIRGLKPPYVLVANHVTMQDPFILAAGCPEPVYWVTADGNMRTRFIRFWLRRVGSIPKSKVIPDIETVNMIVDVVRKRKGVVGIFPEGQASWDGRTLPVFPSTAKLLKILRVPVVAARIEGAYLSQPRWARAMRRGRVRVSWELILRPEELKELTAEEILERLQQGISHDEYEAQARARIEYRGGRRAEGVELALYMCPSCGAIGSLRGLGNRLRCPDCGASWRMDRFGWLKASGAGAAASPAAPAAAGGAALSSIRDWSAWQATAFAAAATAALDRPGEAFLEDGGAVFFRGRKMTPLRRIRTGRLRLYPDRLELATLSGEVIRMPLSSLDGIGVLKRDRLEFYEGRTLWQVRFIGRSVSARKWADALELFRRASPARP